MRGTQAGGRCLLLRNAPAEGPGFLQHLPQGTVDVVPQYEADGLALESYAALLLPTHVDQRHLFALGARLDAYLDQRGAILFNGHVTWPFLPELQRFDPVPIRNLEGLTIHRELDHPIFEGIAPADLTYRRGVAGFYGRGSNPPPRGAKVLHSVGPAHQPVDWIFERPGGGRLFVHSGNDIFDFLVRPQPLGAEPLRRLLHWLLENASGEGP